MKKALFIFVALIISLQSQTKARAGEVPFFKLGKEWVVEYRNHTDGTTEQARYRVTSATVLGGVKYWMIDYAGSTSHPFSGWATEDGAIITHAVSDPYYRYLEMDLSVEPGDEIGYINDDKIVSDTEARELIEYPLLKVLEKDTIEVRGVRRTRIKLARIEHPENTGYWVEGIGLSSRAFSATSYMIPTGERSTTYTFIGCYEDGELVFDKKDFEAPSLAPICEVTIGAMDDAAKKVDVYNMQGICVRQGVARSEALDGLPAGIYIVDGKKIQAGH